jgi:type I restriction enzyme, S subunit
VMKTYPPMLDYGNLSILPSNWCWGRIEDAGADERNAIVDGPFGSNLKLSDYVTSPGVPVLTTANLRGDYGPLAVRYITNEKYIELRRSEVRAGDVLVAKIGSCGRTGIYPDGMPPAIIPANLLKISVHPYFSRRYLLHYLNSPIFSRFLKKIVSATAQPAFNVTTFRYLPFAIAPQVEQTRIADCLDELLSDLDAGVTALERVREKLKLYRASVLKGAVEGTLTGLDSHYPMRPLGEAILSMGQGWSPKCDSKPSDDWQKWAVIKTTAIQSLQYLEQHNKVLPASLEPRPLLELCVGDLLVTRAGPRSRVGVACLVRQTRPRLLLCDKAYRLRCREDVVVPAFLEIVLNAPQMVDELEKLKTGISDSGVNLTQNRFSELLVPCPPIKVQQAVVETVEDHLSIIEHLEGDLDTNLKNSRALRQSILRHAFTGQLVSQDPNDEPASELLRRIAAERAKASHSIAQRTTTSKRVRRHAQTVS